MKKEKKNKLSHFAAVFPVPDAVKAAEWYRDKLGFDFDFKWGEPTYYAVVSRDNAVAIHFTKTESDTKIQPCVLYIFCHNVDEVYEEFSDKDIPKMTTPQDADYGMRDFELTDPYDNRLVFGMGIE